MPFQKGQVANPHGRPKIDRSAEKEVSVRKALERVVRTRPDLLEDTIERLFLGRGALGMLELAAKLTRELQDEGQANKIAIVFTGTLNPNALKQSEIRQVDAKVIDGKEIPHLQQAERPLPELQFSSSSEQIEVREAFRTEPGRKESTESTAP